MNTNPSFSESIAAAFEWWRDAGVDYDYGDDPRNWLAENQKPKESKREESVHDQHAKTLIAGIAAEQNPSVRIQNQHAILEESIPNDLAAFTEWFLQDPSVGFGRTGERLAPRGSAAATTMIVVGQPEMGDAQAGSLLSGQQGALLDAILAAMQLPNESVYIASVLPRHTPHADREHIAHMGFGTILKRHIALVQPQNLIVFDLGILPLLGHNTPHNTIHLPNFNLESQSYTLLASRSLGALLQRPKWKAELWQRWLDVRKASH